MKKRFFFITSSLIVILVCAVILLLVWLFPLLSSPDGANVNAALTALDRTPVSRVERVNVFTGGGLEHSVEGVDSIGRKLYVFISGNQVFSVYENRAISAQKASSIVLHAGFPIRSIVSVMPGIFKLAGSGKAVSVNSLEVWEITARLTNGEFLFVYLDLRTGRRIYEFTTSPLVAVNPQVTGAF